MSLQQCILEEAVTGMDGLGQTDTYQAEQVPTPYEYPLPWKSLLSTGARLTAVGAAPTIGQAAQSAAYRYLTAPTTAMYASTADFMRNVNMYKKSAEAAEKVAEATDKLKMWVKLTKPSRGEAMIYSRAETAAMQAAARNPSFSARAALQQALDERSAALARQAATEQVAAQVYRETVTPGFQAVSKVAEFARPVMRFIGGKLIPIASIANDVYNIAGTGVDAVKMWNALNVLEQNIPAEVAASETRMGASAGHRAAAMEQAKLFLLRGYATAIARLERVPQTSRGDDFTSEKLWRLRAKYAQLERSAPWNR